MKCKGSRCLNLLTKYVSIEITGGCNENRKLCAAKDDDSAYIAAGFANKRKGAWLILKSIVCWSKTFFYRFVPYNSRCFIYILR